VDRVGRAGALFPLAVIVLFALMDFAAGPRGVVLGLVVIGPLLAASLTGCTLTTAYGVLAFLVAVLLGFYDGQYTPEGWPVQAVQLFGVAVGGVIARAACDARLQREARLRQLGAEAAAADVRASEAERAASFAEALQRDLLASPPRLAGADLAVRYLPAGEHVRIGGDWYDAFPSVGGGTMLVVGDVAGHDGRATLTMTEVRNVLRGIAQVLPSSPAAVLRALDRALHGLGRRTLATVVLAELTTQQDGSGGLFRWSNAGHPPPLLIYGDGVVRWLEHEPDLLLGVDPAAPRADHRSTLGPGDTVVLFTDGLVEHRGRSIDEGMHAVRSAAIAAADRSVEDLCDALLDCLDDDRTDDVALLVVRIRSTSVHLGAGRSMR
jgi:serine phosphatase RsbU (regulator of sigma subunit)